MYVIESQIYIAHSYIHNLFYAMPTDFTLSKNNGSIVSQGVRSWRKRLPHIKRKRPHCLNIITYLLLYNLLNQSKFRNKLKMGKVSEILIVLTLVVLLVFFIGHTEGIPDSEKSVDSFDELGETEIFPLKVWKFWKKKEIFFHPADEKLTDLAARYRRHYPSYYRRTCNCPCSSFSYPCCCFRKWFVRY